MAGFFTDLDTWLTSIEAQKTALAANLTTQGVSAADTEALSALVDKVLDIVVAPTLTGDATEADVLAGKTFYSDDPDTKLTGTAELGGTAFNVWGEM